jgi:hypothetical protein
MKTTPRTLGSRDDSTTNLLLRTGDVPAELNGLGKLELASVVVVMEATGDDGDHVGLDGVETGPMSLRRARTRSAR